jgi:hypothetical protein
MSDDNKTVHADIILTLKGGPYDKTPFMEMIHHGNVSGDETSVDRLRQISSLLFEAAWLMEDQANKFSEYESLRVFEDTSGNQWFEVKTDVFYCASDLEEAQSLFVAGAPNTTEKALRAVNGDKLKEVK